MCRFRTGGKRTSLSWGERTLLLKLQSIQNSKPCRHSCRVGAAIQQPLRGVIRNKRRQWDTVSHGLVSALGHASQPNLPIRAWPSGLCPAPANHTITQTRRGIRIGLGKLLCNLTRQVYVSNYALSILFIVHTLYFKVEPLKTKTVAMVMPKMYQLFLMKDFVCVQRSRMASQMFIACVWHLAKIMLIHSGSMQWFSQSGHTLAGKTSGVVSWASGRHLGWTV